MVGTTTPNVARGGLFRRGSGSVYALRHVDPLMTVEAKGKAIMEHANGQDVV